MDITFNPQASQISPMRAARFAPSGAKEAQAAGRLQDKMEISHEGQQAAAEAEQDFDQSWKNLEVNLSRMTKDEFISMVREQLGEQKLEINWKASVDPDGSIWAKSYCESLISQYEEARSAIERYYSSPYQEALHSPLGSSLPQQLNFIAAKYQCSWSDYFDGSMPAGERQWTYTQVRAMLTGTGVRLNDPYALKDSGLNIKDMDKIARQTATDKIAALIRQAKEATRTTD